MNIEGHPSARHMNDEEKKFVVSLRSSGSKPHQILTILNKERKYFAVTAKDIENYVIKQAQEGNIRWSNLNTCTFAKAL